MSALQRAYYTRTAALYDKLHVSQTDEHSKALGYVSDAINDLGITSILDVGAGTGRALLYLREYHPSLSITGVEAVPALIDQAVLNGVPRGSLLEADALRLPFPDNHFDAVCAFALLHHVKQTKRAISEMCRVARHAIFISDGNRFGHGSLPSRWLKLALYKSHLWPLANLIKTMGRGYTITETDGVAYSYSVYDNLEQLQQWADKAFIIPTSEPTANTCLHPILNTHQLLVCAFKDQF